MTSVGREKKELEGGGGAEDCQSSEDKYPSKGREGGKERKGKRGKVTEGWEGMTKDTERGDTDASRLSDVKELESFKMFQTGRSKCGDSSAQR